MSLSLYALTVPAYIHALTQLSAWLTKAEKYADEKNIPHSQLISGKLIEDMKPLSFQVQVAGDTAKGILTRIAGTEPVSMVDDETTFEDLHARIAKTIELLKAVDEKAFVNKEDAEVTMKAGPNEYKFTGLNYVRNYSTPNFYFHISMAYAILRKSGVPIGKWDYLGSIL